MAAFEEAVDRFLAGDGAVLLVRGEPGVGKSRLLAEWSARARSRGMAVLAGRAVQGGGPYRPISDALLTRLRDASLPAPDRVGPFAGALARLVPGWAARPPETAVPDLSLMVGEAMLRLLAAHPDGAALVLDDLHWADPDTLTVLDRVAEAAADTPVLVVGAARDEPVPALERIARAAAVQVVRLGRLEAEQVGDLVAACGDGAALPDAVLTHVADRADGLPFLAEEMLGALVDTGVLVRTAGGWELTTPIRAVVPASFSAVVGARLESLGTPARAVVEAAAVLGREPDWRLLPAMTRMSEVAVLDALRNAVDRRLVEHDGTTFRFVHALTRDAVRAFIPAPVRTTLARDGATAWNELAPDDTPATLEQRAELYQDAGDEDQAARLLHGAARAAGSAVGYREDLLRRALRLAGDRDDLSTEIGLDLAEVLVLAGRVGEAREAGDRLLNRLPPTDRRRAALNLTLARAAVLTRRWAEAQDHLDAAGPGPATDAVAAHVALGLRRPRVAERLAAAVLGRASDPAIRCEALEIMGRCARLEDRIDAAESAFTEALHLAEARRLTVWQVRALHELGTLDLLGPARHDRLDRARGLAVDTGLLSTAAQIDLQLAGCHGLRVDPPATLAVTERGEDLARSLGLVVLAGAMRIFAALAHGHTGRTAAMHADLDVALQRVGDDVDLACFVTFIRGVPAMLDHDLTAWRPTLEAGMGLVRANPAASPTPFRGLYALVETTQAANSADAEPGRAARDELRASGATVQAANQAALCYADAVAAARAGRDPAPLLQAAETAMAPLVWRRHHARLLVCPAALQDGWGRPLDWLREANSHFESTGDTGLARACREVLRAAGAPVPRRGRGNTAVPAHLQAFGVTSREMDVLTLLADGHSNAEIATRLVLSVRTVETHVANLLAKTGTIARAALANSVLPHR